MKNYIKNIKLKNFRCYENLNSGKGLDLAVPQRNKLGSGMSILIGENNSGKTSFLNALVKIRDDREIQQEDKFDVNGKVEIEITDKKNKKIIGRQTNGIFLSVEKPKGSLDLEEVTVIKDNRIWTSGYNSVHKLSLEPYERRTKREEIDNTLAGRLGGLENKENPELKKEFLSLLKQIYPNFNDWETISVRGNKYISCTLKTGKKLDIDYSLGSGILNIFSILLALIEKKEILFIDEPEAFLHPLAQIELSELLCEYSRKHQVVLSTHSPYMFKLPLEKYAKIILFKNTDDKYTTSDITDKSWGIFGEASPTWGEINYYAYNLPTVEFHNELYGFIQSKKTKDDRELSYQEKFDEFLDSTSYFEQSKSYFELKKDGTYKKYNCTLATYVRNKIHHPENPKNDCFSDTELRESTEQLIKLIEFLK